SPTPARRGTSAGPGLPSTAEAVRRSIRRPIVSLYILPHSVENSFLILNDTGRSDKYSDLTLPSGLIDIHGMVGCIYQRLQIFAVCRRDRNAERHADRPATGISEGAHPCRNFLGSTDLEVLICFPENGEEFVPAPSRDNSPVSDEL